MSLYKLHNWYKYMSVEGNTYLFYITKVNNNNLYDYTIINTINISNQSITNVVEIELGSHNELNNNLFSVGQLEIDILVNDKIISTLNTKYK